MKAPIRLCCVVRCVSVPDGRLQSRCETLRRRPGHHPGSSVGWRPDQSFVHHAGRDARAPHHDHSESTAGVSALSQPHADTSFAA